MSHGINNFKYSLFGHQAFHFIPSNDVWFLQSFQGIIFIGIFVLRQDNLSEELIFKKIIEDIYNSIESDIKDYPFLPQKRMDFSTKKLSGLLY